jgi:acyl dehydratase
MPGQDSRDLPIGHKWEPLQFEATAELNQQFLFAEEDFDPKYWDSSNGKVPIVHPSLVLNMSNPTRSPSYNVPGGAGGIHVRDETTFLNPARIGDKLTVTWEIIERYEKRERKYRITSVQVKNQEGLMILRRRLHGTVSEKL